MDINKALRTAVSTGKVYFGLDQTIKSVDAKKAKLLICAENMPKGELDALNEHSEKPAIYTFKGNNMDLGAACGKPFGVSVISIVNEGDSAILSLRN